MPGTISPEWPSGSDKRGAAEGKLVTATKAVTSALNAILNSENKVDPTLFSESQRIGFKPYYKEIATEENYTSTSVGYFPTADKIEGITLTKPGFIEFIWGALMKTDIAGETTLFQQTFLNGNTVILGEFKASTTAFRIYDLQGSHANITWETGLTFLATSKVYVPAGTHEIGIKFKTSSGHTITSKERKFWAFTYSA